MYLQVFFVGLLAGISPGPDFVIVMRNSLAFGTRIGIATALGISLALIVHVTYTIMGYALLLTAYPAVYRVVQILGALYLARLGYQAVKMAAASSAEVGTPEQDRRSFGQGLRDGFLCNLLNPKAALFFLSIFSQFIEPTTPAWVRWVYGLEIVAAVGGWFTFLSLVITSAQFRSRYARYEVYVNRLLGFILLYFAIRIAVLTNI